MPDLDRLAEYAFSSVEQAALTAAPPERRLDTFFGIWTAKEAYLKGRGDGLTRPLDSFDVALAPAPTLLVDRLDPDAAEQWSLRRLAAPPGYLATLAVQGPPPVVRERWWQGGLR
jgi:4'-phosphopantetheinyl transferase